MLQSYISQYIPFVGAIDLIFITVILLVVGIWYTRQFKKKDNLFSTKHNSELYNIYDRLNSISIKEDSDGKIMLKVQPAYQSVSHLSEKEKKLKVIEYYDMPYWYDLSDIHNLDYALVHLKHYKKVYKYWKKTKRVLDGYNEIHDINTKKELSDNLKNFKDELKILIDKIKNGHQIKGKCDICP